jgi:hypothetical protein
MMQAIHAERKVADAKSENGVRWPFIMLCCLPLLVERAKGLLTPSPVYDFITYWSAGHLFLTGGHPYSAKAMLATERLYGWTFASPMMTFCPPWALPIVAIMALPPFREAQIGWFAVSLLLNCLSAIGLWNYFGGEKQKAWIAIIVAATFIPMGGVELLGQITSLTLASLTAFLLLMRSERYFAAGLLTLGFGLKPHLLYLVLLAILFWGVKRRTWTMLAGIAASYTLAIAVAQICNPNSMDYFGRSFGTAMGISCGAGGVLRSIFGVQHLWLQFLPSFFGIAWFLYYWVKHQNLWEWQTHLPLLLLVSISSAPYYWYHDFILILPVLIVVAVHRGYRNFFTIVAYLAIQEIILAAYGLSDAWRGSASLLWIAFYCIAKAEAGPDHREDHEAILPGISSQHSEA